MELTSDAGMQIERRELVVAAPPEDAYAIFTGLGGDRGCSMPTGCGGCAVCQTAWLAGRDSVVGGAIPMKCAWATPWILASRSGGGGPLLRLHAEMKLPGEAWLQFEALPRADGQTL